MDGINIQFPISQLILSGEKTVETRTYPIPKKLVGQKLALIETPGRTGNFPARIVGFITFGESWKYASKGEFYADIGRHCVLPNSPWKWTREKPKWGWPIQKIEPLKHSIKAPNRKGIRFTKNISIGLP